MKVNPIKKAKGKAKRSIASATGVPTTKSGRAKKAGKLEGQVILWIVVIIAIVWLASK